MVREAERLRDFLLLLAASHHLLGSSDPASTAISAKPSVSSTSPNDAPLTETWVERLG